MFGQSLSQDADGFSTIILPSTNFNLDIADNEANFNFATYLRKNKKPLKASESGWLIGGDLKGKVENEIASIFSGGNVATNAEANFVFGRKGYKEWLNDDDQIRKTKLEKEKKKIDLEIDNTRQKYYEFLESLLNKKEIDSVIYKTAFYYLLENNEEVAKEIKESLDLIKAELNEVPIEERKYDPTVLDVIVGKRTDKFKRDLGDSRLKSKSINDLEREKTKFFFHKIYFRGGLNGSNFKFDLGQDSTTVESRFEERDFNGWNAELGYNIQYMDDHFFGFSYQLRQTNNLSDLEEQEFTLVTKDTTITDGQFTSSTSVKAFSGEYEEFKSHSLNFDYVWVTPIKDKDNNTSDVFLAINPYIRHRIYDGSKKLKNNTVLGVALNAFSSKKQKIMAGLSIQTNDLFRVHDDEEPVLRDRIGIGLIARFSFSGISAEKKED